MKNSTKKFKSFDELKSRDNTSFDFDAAKKRFNDCERLIAEIKKSAQVKVYSKN